MEPADQGCAPRSRRRRDAYSINGGIALVAWSRGIEVTVNTADLKALLETATRVAKLAFAHL
jgi:hypothetical protein